MALISKTSLNIGYEISTQIVGIKKGRWIFQFIFTIAMGFPLGIHFGNLLDLSPIGIGFLAGGISLLAHIITTPMLDLQR